MSTAAAAAAAQTHPIGIILTRELVENINDTYDLKINHESNKVRRAIKNRRTTDSDGGADEQQQRGRGVSISGGEGPPDGSPVKGGVGSSGGQILSGIGSLASGLRLGTGAGDAGSIVNPTADLTGFIHSVMGHGSHKDNIRRVKERRKESADLVPTIGGVGKEKDGVVGGGLKLLWSGRVADIVRMREMDVDLSSGTGGGAGTHDRDRDRDRWKKQRLPAHVASDGELDEKGRKTFDGRSTEEESDSISISGQAQSFGGMWGGRVRGKLGNWSGYVGLFFFWGIIVTTVWSRLTRKKHQSVDLTTHSSRASPVIKHPVTPQNQNRSHISVGSVGMSRQASSTPSHVSGVQSPTMVIPLYVFFNLVFWFIA